MIRSIAINWSWQEGDMNTCLPIFLSFIFFIVYWFISRSEKIKAAFYNKYEFDLASVNYITFNRIVGFLSMGVIPGALCLILMPAYPLADYGLNYDPETILFTIAWIFGLSLLVIPVAYFSAQKSKNLVNYPQIRARIWTKRTVLINALGWALYLFGYEFLFRGILLFPLAEHLGIWTSIAINIALYSATHIPKGLDETIGAIPLGLIFCLLTLASGTIWIAFFVHLIMAWTNSFTALKFHPDIHFKKSEK